MLTHDMTQRLFDNLTPEQKHDAWLAAQAVGAIPPSTPDPATLDENGDLYVDPDSEVIEDPDDYADPFALLEAGKLRVLASASPVRWPVSTCAARAAWSA